MNSDNSKDLVFNFKHPENGETRKVIFTESEIREYLEDMCLWDRFYEEFCDCERYHVGESYFDGCNCCDYAEEFELEKEE